jgi:hypothetical protein
MASALGVKKRTRRKTGTREKVREQNDSPDVIPERILPRMQGRILAEMKGIIDELILKAKTGRYTDAKFLFRFAEVGSIPLAGEEEPRVDAK